MYSTARIQFYLQIEKWIRYRMHNHKELLSISLQKHSDFSKTSWLLKGP